MVRTAIVFAIFLAGNLALDAEEPSGHGFRVHKIESPFQSGPTQIRVLQPDQMEQGKIPAVIYVLPVEAGDGSRYGDGLVEIKKRGSQNRHGIIFVAPTFSELPWYCDHPTNQRIRQETYFIDVVVPFVEQNYSVQKQAAGRMLLGFSKSGWGAWSLLLRHPDLFGRAAAWDAPLMMDQLGKYGTTEIFGTQENFQRYAVSELLRTNAGAFKNDKRLILTGYGGFRSDHQRVHTLLDELKVPHEYRDGPKREHTWHSGWVEEAVQLLVSPPEIESRR